MVLRPLRPETKNDSAGEGQHQFTQTKTGRAVESHCDLETAMCDLYKWNRRVLEHK
jgi:hypothetical protein